MPHLHNQEIPHFTHKELLDMDYEWGGEIRPAFRHSDGSYEAVALNNLVAVISRFASDINGNKFGAYFVVPEEYWVWCMRDMEGRWGKREPSRNEDGGYVGVIANCTLYVGGTNEVLCRTDHNGLCWYFDVTSGHELMRRHEIKALVGKNMGFDDVVVFHPLLGCPPRPLLEQWAGEGYESAKDMVAKLDAGYVPYQLHDGKWTLLHGSDLEKLAASTTKIELLDMPKADMEGEWRPIS